MDCKAVSERVGVSVDVDHMAVLLDDVPDLHAREGKNESNLRDVVC